jgi:hypothetical protein
MWRPDHHQQRSAARRRVFRDVFQPPGDAYPIPRQHRPEKFVIVAAADPLASFDWQLPDVADVAVLVGRPMSVLVGLTYKGRRRDYRGIAGSARIRIIDIERVVVADCEREVADRRAPDLVRGGVADLAANPSSKLVCQ